MAEKISEELFPERDLPMVELEEELEDEESSHFEMDSPFDPTKINVQIKQDTLQNLISRLQNNEIDMNTSFQRHSDLWKPVQMSRLIESMLIRFPIPGFYFDATNDDCWLVVDGLQRLSAIRRFVIDKENPLTLRGLEYLSTELDGKTFDSLSRNYQRRINECPVFLFLIMPGTPDAVKYSLFQRINTGGLTLNNQEIRNALAKERERQFFESLAQNKNLKLLMGDLSKRLRDQELVLRFFAFHLKLHSKGVKNIQKILDNAFESIKGFDKHRLDQLKSIFSTSMDRCARLFGGNAFQRTPTEGQARRVRKNSPLFETWSVCLAELSEGDAEKLITRREELVKKLDDLVLDDQDFIRSISMSTQKEDHIQIRYSRIRSLIKEVLDA